MGRYVLFVCTGNSARSQMAEGFFNFYNKNPKYVGVSAGTHPSKSIKPYAVKVMNEKGIDMGNQQPKVITWSMVNDAHIIYAMGCTKGCPVTPPEKTKEWKFKDPAGKSIEEYRNVRDKIERRIKKLVYDLNK
ncbi:MAG: arsenate reductase ArsC [Candidatus Pacearchaeota archaeon]